MAIQKRPVIAAFLFFLPHRTATTLTRPQRAVNARMALKFSIPAPNFLAGKRVFTKQR